MARRYPDPCPSHPNNLRGHCRDCREEAQERREEKILATIVPCAKHPGKVWNCCDRCRQVLCEKCNHRFVDYVVEYDVPNMRLCLKCHRLWKVVWRLFQKGKPLRAGKPGL